MKISIWSGTFAAALFSVTIAAQQPSSSTQPPRPSTSPTEQQPSTTPQSPAARSDSGASKVTITGCLQAAPEMPTGTAGTSGSSAGAAAMEKFVLTNASATPATAAPGSPSASDSRTYRLVANESALAPHAGKKNRGNRNPRLTIRERLTESGTIRFFLVIDRHAEARRRVRQGHFTKLRELGQPRAS